MITTLVDRNMVAYLNRTMTDDERHKLFDLNGHLMPEFNAVALYWNDEFNPYLQPKDHMPYDVDEGKGGWTIRVHLYRAGQPGIYTVYLDRDQVRHLSHEGKAEAIVRDVERQDWEASTLGKLSTIIRNAWGRVFG